jgi:hypothetical protein
MRENMKRMAFMVLIFTFLVGNAGILRAQSSAFSKLTNESIRMLVKNNLRQMQDLQSEFDRADIRSEERQMYGDADGSIKKQRAQLRVHFTAKIAPLRAQAQALRMELLRRLKMNAASESNPISGESYTVRESIVYLEALAKRLPQ